MTTPARIGPARLLPLFFLSGAAGLAAQMVWTRMFAAGLGHETPAMLAVTSAFLGGLALGSWKLEPWLRTQSSPARGYALLELAIGIFACVSLVLIPFVNEAALKLAGPTPAPLRQWLVVFVLPFCALLPGTLAMGATLPAMERWLSDTMRTGRGVGALYAANTLGAMAGTMGAVFVLMPGLGFRGSLLVCAATNLVCAAWAGWIASRSRLGEKAEARRSVVCPPPHVGGYGTGLTATLLLTGLLGITFQFGVVRVLSQVIENTIYSYASVLAVYLGATALGAALYQRFGSGAEFGRALGNLLVGLSAAVSVSLISLPFSQGLYHAARGALGDSLAGTVGAEMLLSAATLALPAILMGATFSHLVQGAKSLAGGIGCAGAINTLGCALAGPLVVIALPVAGLKWLLLALPLGYLALALTTGAFRWCDRRWSCAAGLLALGIAVPVELRIIDRPDDSEVVAALDGAMASVAVVKTSDGHRSLRVNNRLQMGGTSAAMAERRQAHLPLLLHPAPKRALFLGPGTGITLGAAGTHPGLSVDGVELVPEVARFMRHFEPENEGPLPKPGVSVSVADARRFVRTTTNRYDVIVADLFHPAHDGAGFLYTSEHFDAVRQRLAPGGLFCQWLPLHQLDESVLRAIVRTFIETFSDTRAFLLHFNVDIPALALVGSADRLAFATDAFEQRVGDAGLRARLRGVGLDRVINVAGCFLADREQLRLWAHEGASVEGASPRITVSTDDFPTVLFAAPRFAVRRDTTTHGLLLALLERFRVDDRALESAGLVTAGVPFAGEVREFIAARDLYLKGLVEEGAGRLDAALDLYVESARRSLQFTPGYARCVTVIQLLAKTDRARARALFERLEAAQPAQPLGRRLLGPLFAEP